MLSHKILTRQDIGRAAGYYEDGADDYYAKEGDVAEWQGKGAEALDLSGEIDSARFRELLAGQVSPGVRLSRSATRDDSKDRIGIDFTFSAPKSVSLQALVSGDARIIQAHDKAVAKALEVAEGLAQARQKVQGKTRVEDTGNIIVGKFRHETNREQEPQLHTHAVIMNLTQREDGQWRALKNDKLIKSTRYLGSVYNSELAAELQKAGYNLRFERDGNFELAHIDRKQIEGFSSRSAQVEKKLAEKGLDRTTATAAEKQQAAMQSRAKKAPNVDRAALHGEWKARAKELGINFDRSEWAGLGAEKDNGKHVGRSQAEFMPADEAAKRAVRYAVNHLTERQAVMGSRELIETAVEHSVGSAQLTDIEKEITKQTASGFLIKEATRYRPADISKDAPARTRPEWIANLQEIGLSKDEARARVDAGIQHGGLVADDARYTTQTALEREKRILQIERDGREAVEPVMQAEAARAILEPTNLNSGQRSAAELIATTGNRVIGVQGSAGVGKSHMLDTAKGMIEGQGYNVRALAPYASQVKALRELGVQSNTLASFLKAKEKNIDARTVLVIDEAGVVPTRQMEQVLKLAERAGARVVLMGDKDQTKAIEAGRPFDQLQTAGMKTAFMEEIQRQKDAELKIAVELAAKGDAKSSLARIAGITQIENHSLRRDAVAESYASLTPEERDNTIIVSGTNEARREINKYVREKIGTVGQGLEVDTLVRRDTTQAERRFSKNYRHGDVIQPEKDYKSGLKRGELYTVEDTGPGNRLTVRSQRDESVIKFNPLTHGKISVYEPERAEFSPGDIIRITRNDAAKDLANGDRFKVQSIEPGKIVLGDESRRVELSTKEPLHASHAYATTVHSSQGLTSNRVIIDFHAESKTTAKDVYYVAISRARFQALIFTNDKKKLPAAIARENVKYAALDLARGRAAPQRQTENVHQKGGQGAQKDHSAQHDRNQQPAHQKEQRAEKGREKERG